MKLNKAINLFEEFKIEVDQDGNPSGTVDGKKVKNLGDIKEVDVQRRNLAFLMSASRYLRKNQGYDERAQKKQGGGWQNIISNLADPPDVSWDGKLDGIVQINWEAFKYGGQAGKTMDPLRIKASDLIKYMTPAEKKLFIKKG